MLRGGIGLGALGSAGVLTEPGTPLAWAALGLGLLGVGWGAWREAHRPVPAPRPAPPRSRCRLRLVTASPQLGEEVQLRLQVPPSSSLGPQEVQLWLHVPHHSPLPLRLCACQLTLESAERWYDLTARLPRLLPAGPVTLSVGRTQCRLPNLRPARPLQLRRQLDETQACEALLNGPDPGWTAAQLYGVGAGPWSALSDEDYRRAFPVTAGQLAAYATATGWTERHIRRAPSGEPLPVIVETDGGFSLLRPGGHSEYEVIGTAPTQEALVMIYLLGRFPWLPRA
ncbi:hypothetical protein C8263_05350 [Deinococcus arcticus]|uniref:Uncharacterized protein n=1 Tax=Deinococcus arcticus TaxID=2136176 RepID=A0A2T3W9T7_9DEIO|nr:hypothetical protein C8263_05350 [Deinococcus arcticus]